MHKLLAIIRSYPTVANFSVEYKRQFIQSRRKRGLAKTLPEAPVASPLLRKILYRRSLIVTDLAAKRTNSYAGVCIGQRNSICSKTIKLYKAYAKHGPACENNDMFFTFNCVVSK